MAWQRVDFIVAGSKAEALAEALAARGAISTEISDALAGTAGERAIIAEPGADARLWPECRVRALFALDADVARATEEAFGEAEVDSVRSASIDRLEDADWVASTQRQFSPIRSGERLWIVPSWETAPRPEALNIVLDPGAAFGTGSHATTRLCLAWLEREVRPGDSVLDYGCGSGILAIAAVRLGAVRSIAVDIDPLALEAARYNAGRNRVDIAVHDAARDFPGTARIAIANILANPLRMLAPIIASRTDMGGRIALSGILEEQAAEVRDAYAPWADLRVEARDEGWALLAGTRQ